MRAVSHMMKVMQLESRLLQVEYESGRFSGVHNTASEIFYSRVD